MYFDNWVDYTVGSKAQCVESVTELERMPAVLRGDLTQRDDQTL